MSLSYGSLYLFTFLLLLSLQRINCSENIGKVILSNVIFRHGNRTIINPYPTDPYRDPSLWPVEFGQLTEDGMRGHYDLGKWLRQRYSALLPEKYDLKDVHVISTDVDRTLMSAQCNLAGLYEPDPAKNWNPNIHWRPIPIHTVPGHLDKILYGKAACPKYSFLLTQIANIPSFKAQLAKYKHLFESVSAVSGIEVKDFVTLNDIYNNLFIEKLFGFKLPNWTETVYPEPMKTAADFSFTISTYTPELARLKIGNLIGQIVKNIQHKVNGTLHYDRKLFIYSAHDETVANFLNALNIFNGIAPPYFSTILLELREVEGEHFVTIYYRNSSLTPPYLLKLPGCSELCNLEKFVSLVNPVIPLDWDYECRLNIFTEMYSNTNVDMVAYALAVAVFIIVLLVSVQMIRHRRVKLQEFSYQSLSVEAT